MTKIISCLGLFFTFLVSNILSADKLSFNESRITTDSYQNTIDLYQLFQGDNITFSIENNDTKPIPQIEVSITPKEQLYLNTDISAEFPGVGTDTGYNITAVRFKKPYLLVLGQKQDGNYSLCYYKLDSSITPNKFQKELFINIEVSLLMKNYINSDPNRKKQIKTFYLHHLSFEIISIDEFIFFNTIWSSSPNPLSINLEDSKIEIMYSGKFGRKLDSFRFNTSENPKEILKRRRLDQKIFSAYFDYLFITSTYLNTDTNQEYSRIDYITIDKLEMKHPLSDLIKGSNLVKFGEGNDPYFTSFKIMTTHIYVGFKNKIVRLDVEGHEIGSINTSVMGVLKLNKSKTFEFDRKSSQFIVEVGNHTDLLITLENQDSNQVQRVRWDNFNSPFLLEDLNFEQPIHSISSSFNMVIFVGKDLIAFRQSQTNTNYMEIINPETPSDPFYYRYNQDNYLLLNKGSGNLVVSRYSLSTYLKVKVSKDTSFVVVASNRKDYSRKGKFNFIYTEDNNNKIELSRPISEITEFLNEELTSKQVYMQSLPINWFQGLLLDFKVTCPLMKNRNPKFIKYEKLKPKSTNINSQTAVAPNIFYYKFGAHPLQDGSYLLLIQIDLNIYLKKCILSSENKLKCRVVYKDKTAVNDQKRILEAQIIQDEFLIYKNEASFTMIDFRNGGFLAPKEVKFLNGLSTCKFEMFNKLKYLLCIDYSSRKLLIYEISTGLKQLVVIDNFYASKIELSPLHANQLFALGNNTLSVISYRTNEVRQVITSEILSQSDAGMMLCGRYILVHSSSLNSIEIYDTLEIENVKLLKSKIDFSPYGLYFQSGVKLSTCKDYFPLILNDRQQTLALLIDIDEPQTFSFKELINIGKHGYYSNYFISGLYSAQKGNNGINSKTVWSILDTSNIQEGNLGEEYEVFDNYQIVFDTREEEFEEKIKTFDCSLQISKFLDPLVNKTIPFKLGIENTSLDIEVANTKSKNKSSASIEEPIGLLDQDKKIDVSTLFTGNPLVYITDEVEEDITQQNIQFDPLYTNVAELSKIMKSSREETVIQDIGISKNTNSIYVLTRDEVYKLKKGSIYFISQSMRLDSEAIYEEKKYCRNIFVLSSLKLVWILCHKARIPYLFLSNWGSLTPSLVFQRQLPFSDIDDIQSVKTTGTQVFIIGKKNDAESSESILLHYDLQLEDDQIRLKLLPKNETSNSLGYPIFMDFVITPVSTYVVSFQGSLENVGLSSIVVNRIEKDTVTTFKVKMTDLFDVRQRTAFSVVTGLKCSQVSTNKTSNISISNNQEENLECIILQDLNMHYEIKIETHLATNSFGKSDVNVTVAKVYASYGNFVNSFLEFDDKYLVVVASEPRIDVDEHLYTKEKEIGSVYAMVYDRKHQGEELYQIGGIPLFGIGPDDKVLMRVRDNKAGKLLLLSTETYYSMIAVQLSSQFDIVIDKSKITNNLTISAFNHYSKGKVDILLKDSAMLYILLAMVGLFTVLMAFFVLIWKKRHRKTRGETLDQLGGILMEQAMTTEEKELILENADIKSASVISSFRFLDSVAEEQTPMNQDFDEDEDKEDTLRSRLRVQTDVGKRNIINEQEDMEFERKDRKRQTMGESMVDKLKDRDIIISELNYGEDDSKYST